MTQLFADGLVGEPPSGSPDADVATDAHSDFALQAAEQSAVLLKDTRDVLPLDPSPQRSLAVIGADASAAPVVTGYGSSRVVAPFVSTPLDAIRLRLGTGARVSYVNGGSTTRNLPAVPGGLLTPASGPGHGLTLTLTRTGTGTGGGPVGGSLGGGGVGGQSLRLDVPTADLVLAPHAAASRRLTGGLVVGAGRALGADDLSRPRDPGHRCGGGLPYPHQGHAPGWMDRCQCPVHRDPHPPSDRPLHRVAAGTRFGGTLAGRVTGGVRPPPPWPRAVVTDRVAEGRTSVPVRPHLGAHRQDHTHR